MKGHSTLLDVRRCMLHLPRMITLTLTPEEADLLDSLLTNAISQAEFASADTTEDTRDESLQTLLDKLKASR